MIQVSLRIIKKGANFPDDILRSVTNCLEQTFAYNHSHQLHKMTQMAKLRLLTVMIQENLMAEIGDDIGGLVSWITEAGGSNSYFLLISCFPYGRLFIRVLVKNKVTSLKENCIDAVGPHMRRRQESEIRKLELPTVLIDKLVEYKMKDEQYYHENATEDIEMTTSQ